MDMVKFLLFLLCSGWGNEISTNREKHPLYVSVTDIEWNSTAKTIEITSKVFLEDLESVLQKKYAKKIDLYATQNETTKTYLLDYFSKNMQISADGKTVPLSIVGYEREKEAIWCYFEIKDIKTLKQINCSNSILYDFIDKQMNLMHVKVAGNTKSIKLLYPDTKAQFSF